MEKKSVINLTKFKTTAELQCFGVVDIHSWKQFQEIRNILFFPTPPSRDEVIKRAERLAAIALDESLKTGAKDVLVACPPWMMQSVCSELIYHGLRPLVSFTKNTSVDSREVVSLVPAA